MTKNQIRKFIHEELRNIFQEQSTSEIARTVYNMCYDAGYDPDYDIDYEQICDVVENLPRRDFKNLVLAIQEDDIDTITAIIGISKR